MSITNLDPPCNLEEVLSINYNIENLQKFLKFLINSDREAYSKIEEISGRIFEVDILRSKVEENNEIIRVFTERFKELDRNIDSMYCKFKVIDNNHERNIEVFIFI